MINNKPYCLDAKDEVIRVGDLVCYTTNSRDSGLSFGVVNSIKEVPSFTHVRNVTTNSWDRVPSIDFRIVVMNTDAKGRPLYKTRWDDASQQHVDTDVQARSGTIHHSSYKFLRL